MNVGGVLLLVEENKVYRSTLNPEPQLIGEAIAAFQYNNQKRESRNPQKPGLTRYVFPCGAMAGSHTRFYKIPGHKH